MHAVRKNVKRDIAQMTNRILALSLQPSALSFNAGRLKNGGSSYFGDHLLISGFIRNRRYGRLPALHPLMKQHYFFCFFLYNGGGMVCIVFVQFKLLHAIATGGSINGHDLTMPVTDQLAVLQGQKGS